MSVSVLDDFAALAVRADRVRQPAEPPPSDVFDPDWRTRAACAGMPLARFYPTRIRDVAAAKAICATCPAKTSCLADALASDRDTDFGVRGGYTEEERQHHRDTEGGQRPINHGSEGGYKTHRRRGEDACDACMAAQRVARYARDDRRYRS